MSDFLRQLNLLQKGLLWGFFGGGFLIIALRLLISGLWGAGMAALIAVTTILLVGRKYHQQLSDSGEERQVAGDNLYYLGLLFTLVSLMLALFQLFVLESGSERVEELIGNFSVALVSTVFGILARILFYSRVIEAEPEEMEPLFSFDETRALRDQLETLRRRLREATDAFGHFNRVTADRAQESVAYVDTMMRKYDESMVKAVSEHLDQATVTLKLTTKTLLDRSDALTRHFEGVIADFNSQLTARAQQGMEVTGAIWQKAAEEMQADGRQRIEQLYGDINRVVSTTEGAWSQMAALGQRISSVGDEVEKHLSAFGNTAKNTADASRSLTPRRRCWPCTRLRAKNTADAGRSLTLFVEHLDDVERRLRVTAEAAAHAAQDTVAAQGEISRIQASLKADLGHVGEATLQGYEAAIKELGNKTRERLQADVTFWRQLSDSIKEVFDQHRQAAAEGLELTQELNRQMSQEALQRQALAERAHRSLIEAIDRLAEKASRE